MKSYLFLMTDKSCVEMINLELKTLNITNQLPNLPS